MIARLQHVGLALTTLPMLVSSAQRRALFREMRAFIRQLPGELKSPLPYALQHMTPLQSQADGVERDVRELADIAALFERSSPLGLCLRRSLTRYYYLRRIGVPVVVHFGAKFVNGQPDREITGHAWLTLNDQVYFEADENWRGFTVMYSFPEDNGKIKP